MRFSQQSEGQMSISNGKRRITLNHRHVDNKSIVYVHLYSGDVAKCIITTRVVEILSDLQVLLLHSKCCIRVTTKAIMIRLERCVVFTEYGCNLIPFK